MEKEYDSALVLGSILIAFLTCFLAIAYASFIIRHKRYDSKLWSFGAAFNMGMGIWAMHFTGMLALHLDVPITFDINETAVTAMIAVLGSYLAFRVLLNPRFRTVKQRKLIAAFTLGTSVAAMHYLGMDAMKMFPPIQYNPALVAASLIIAYVASYIGLKVFIRSSERGINNVFVFNNFLASIILGLAIAAMHYTGMAAANFDLNSYCTVENGINVGALSAYVIGSVVLILISSFLFIIRIQTKDTEKAQNALKEINSQLEAIVEERTKEIKQTLDTLKNTQNQLLEHEKMASLGSLVAGVAHEVNTPLRISITSSNFMKEHIHYLNSLFEEKKLNDAELKEFLRQSQESCTILDKNLNQAAEQISSFKQLAVDQMKDQVFEFNLYETLNNSAMSFRHMLKKHKVNMTLNCDENIVINSHPGALSQVAINLIMNALTHAFDDSILLPSIDIHVINAANQEIEIHFTDNGKGMSKSVIEHAFEPFFTTKEGQGGCGLGLYMVNNLIQKKLKGSIEIASRLDKGSTFIIRMPYDLSQDKCNPAI